MSELRNRTAGTAGSAGGAFVHGGVGFDMPQEMAGFQQAEPIANAATTSNGYSKLASSQKDAEQALGGIPSVFGALEKYGGRRISLWGGINLEAALAGPVAEEAQQWGNLLTWGRLVIAALFFLTFVSFAFVTGFVIKNDGKFPLFWDPITFNKLDNKWEVALESAGPIHVAWMFVLLLLAFSAYHAAHFVPFVANIYARFVFGMRMNPIRWIFHGTAGGIMLGGFAIIMGVSNIFVFVALILIVLTGAASILFMELINRPEVLNDYDETVHTDFITIEGTKRAVVYSEINPWPYVLAVLALVTYVAFTWAYFWHAVSHSANNVPWYAWSIGFLVPLVFLLMAALNGIRYLVNWTIFRFFYIDIAHVLIVDGGIWLGTTLVLIGLALL